MLEPISQESSVFSLGTTPIYNTFLSLIEQQQSPIDTVFINIGTIFRNCASRQNITEMISKEKSIGVETDKPAHALITEAKKEIQQFTQDLMTMMRSNKNIVNPTIVGYYCNYAKCVPNHYRVPAPGKRTIQLAESLLEGLLTTRRKSSIVQGVTYTEVHVPNGTFPHMELINELKITKNRHLVAHVTHHPLDYHVHKSCSSYQLVQSFTGKVVTKNNFSEKVFGTSLIPFNPYTHVLFGDKEDIQGSLSGVEKKRLLEMAQEENWAVKTSDWIYERINQLRIALPFKF